LKQSKLPKPEVLATDTDTIAAVATAAGVGGIGVVRISGPMALAIGSALTGRRLPPRQAVFVPFLDADGIALDTGIALHFARPRSFTGEDVVELQGHGGPIVLQLVLDAVLARGARMARPGEFTERAFLNGKLDLAQAEAVADLIASASTAAARGALRSLQGQFSRAVNAIDGLVLALRVYIEAAMDFPEEGQDFLAEGRVEDRLAEIRNSLRSLMSDTRQGVLLRDGIAVALVGAPNVGKSSLLNRLAGQDRAIVSDLPGTTRDVIHADLSLDGLPIQIVDTAGLRQSPDPVEQEGVRRARDQAGRADLVLLLEDDRDGPDAAALLEELHGAGVEKSRLVRVRNKVDLSGQLPGLCDSGDGITTVRISAMTGAGAEELVAVIKDKVGFAGEGTAFTARRRHVEALREASAALERAGSLLGDGELPELVAEELRGVHRALGSIVGEKSADELLGDIFSTFCIGK
jgi:tRNA modification GTPase